MRSWRSGLPSNVTSPRTSKTVPAEGLRLDGDLLEQAGVDVALAGLVGDEVPQVARLGLADPVDPPEPLLDPVRVPGQVVVDHQVGALEVDALARRIGRDEDDDRGIVLEGRLRRAPLVARQPTMDRDDRLRPPEERADPLDEIVERVAVLGEDDELAPSATGIAHLGRLLEERRELGPLRVGAELPDLCGEGLELLEPFDLETELRDRAGGGGEIDRGLLGRLGLLGGRLVVVDLLDVGDRDRVELRLTDPGLGAVALQQGLGERPLQAGEATLERHVDRRRG